MKRVFIGVVAFAIAMILSAPAARAVDDHLKCYKVKDPLRLTGPPPAWLDLTGPQFGNEQCKIVGGFRLFCVPVSKTVTQQLQRKYLPPGSAFQVVPPNQAYTNFVEDPFVGETLTEDKMCYRIRCTNPLPAPPNPGVSVGDQFGNRDVTNLMPFLVCGPAIKGTIFHFGADGLQETPPNLSPATGDCTLILNDAQTSLSTNCVHNVAGPIAAHIHFAPPGVPGGIVHGYPGVGASPIVDVWDGTDVPPLTPADVANLLAGQLYVNIHTVPFIGGEIRGQIVE